MAFPTNPNIGDTHVEFNTTWTYGTQGWYRSIIGPNNETLYRKAGRAVIIPGVVYADDYNRDVIAAINACPVGGVVQLGEGVYKGNRPNGTGGVGQLNRSDITIRGIARPYFSQDKRSLVGGSIIQGGLFIGGNRVAVENLGIDCGPDWHSALSNPPSTINCLSMIKGNSVAFSDPNDPFIGCRVDNVCLLNIEPLTADHCLVMVNHRETYIGNIICRNAIWGVVLKGSKAIIENIQGYDVGRSVVHIKAEDHAYVNDVVCSNILAENLNPANQTSAIGVFVLAASGPLSNVKVSNAFVNGYRTGFRVGSSFGFVTENVSFSNVDVYNNSAAALSTETDGSLKNFTLDHFRCVSANPRGVEITGANISVDHLRVSTTAFREDAVKLSGSYRANNVSASFGQTQSQPSGITLQPDAAYGSSFTQALNGTLVTTTTVRDADAVTKILLTQDADKAYLEKSIIDALDAFYKGLKDDGTWNNITAAQYMAGAVGFLGAMVPIKGSPTASNPGGQLYSRTQGIKGDRVFTVDSNVPGGSLPQNSFSLGVDITEQATVDQTGYIGHGAGVAGASNIYRWSSTILRFRSRNTSSNDAGSPVLGFVGSSRNSATEFITRVGGTNATQTRDSSTPAAGDVFVFSAASATGSSLSDARLRFWWVGQDINMALLQSRLETLNAAIETALA
jgi:hypothetical protein